MQTNKNGIGVPAWAEIIPFEHDEVILGMEVLYKHFHLPRIREVFFMASFLISAEDSLIWYPILFDTPHNAVRAVAIWLTVLIVIGYVVAYSLLKNRPEWEKVKKFLFVGIIGFFAAVAVTLLIFNFLEDGIVPILFYPILVLILALSASGLMLSFKKNKTTGIIAAILVGLAILATLICIGVHFASGKAAEANWITNDAVRSLWLYVFAALAIAALIFTALYLGRKDKTGFTTRSIAYAAISLALSFALSYLRVLKMPQGGAITIASLLPIMIYSIVFGVKKGVFAGMIYGFLQAIQDPYILHPAQFVLDYPAAFACIGLAGLFTTLGVLKDSPRLQFLFGALVAGVGRFLMHFLSGIFAFGAFAPEGMNVALYSLSYQAAFVFPDLAICIFVGILLFSSKSFVMLIKIAQVTY